MKKFFYPLVLLTAFTISCSSDDDATSTSTLRLNLNGLENLGANFVYEGWIVVNGTPITTGTFTVNDAGMLSKTEFDVDRNQLRNATDFVLSIEPTNDPDPAPSNTKYLAGSFNGVTATVTSGIIGDFSVSTGKYVLGTPTNGNANPNAGVWFMNGNGPSVGLSLPTLDAGWKYEGWVVSNGVVLSTGTFSNPNGPDMSAIYSGMMPSPPFPGEDFLLNAPAGLTFPANLSGATLVISVEPFPDNSPMPFTLKPLSHNVANPAITGTTISMERSLMSFPTGTVSR